MEQEADELAAAAPPALRGFPASGVLDQSQIEVAESWLGVDFRGIRLVGGAVGHESALGSGASALTVGDVIFIDESADRTAGAMRPNLAHELVHVAQQRHQRDGRVHQSLEVGASARQRLIPKIEVPVSGEQGAVTLNGAPLVDCVGDVSKVTVHSRTTGVAQYLEVQVLLPRGVDGVLSPGAAGVLERATDGYTLEIYQERPFRPEGTALGFGYRLISTVVGGAPRPGAQPPSTPSEPTATGQTPRSATPTADARGSGVVPPVVSPGIRQLGEHLADEDSDVDSDAAALTDSELAGLDLTLRLRAIRQVADGWVVGDEDEQTLIRLISLTPTIQSAALLAGLRADSSRLYQRLERVMDGEEYRQYHLALRALTLRSLEAGPAAGVDTAVHDAKILPWSDPGLIKSYYTGRFHYDDVGFTDDGKITFTYWMTFLAMGMQSKTIVVDPNEIIGVHFVSAESHEGADAGRTIFMPAINFLNLINKQSRQEYQLVGEVALLASGVGGAVGAATKVGRAVALLDVAVGAMGVVLTDFRAELAKTPEGQRFLRQWDRFMTVYVIVGGLRMAKELPSAYRSLKAAYADFRVAAGTKLSPATATQLESQLTAMEERTQQAAQEAFSTVEPPAPPHAPGPAPARAPAPDPPASAVDYQQVPFAKLQEMAAADRKAVDELVRRNSLRIVEPEPLAGAKATMPYAELQAMERENAWAAQELARRTGRLDASLKDYRLEQAAKVLPDTGRPVGMRGAQGSLKAGSQTVGGTLAVAETDVAQLSAEFRGASPEAGGPRLPKSGPESHFTPDNADPRGIGHAEERTLAAIDKEIEAAKAAGALNDAQMAGRTVRIHVEDLPCSSCMAGVGHAHTAGPLVKFLDKYPSMRLVVSDAFSGRTVIMTRAADGRISVVAQGSRSF